MTTENSGLRAFENPEFGSVRTVVIEGEPWFVGKDICNALGIKNSRDAMSRLDEDEKATVGISDTSSTGVTQKRNMVLVNEAGLYHIALTSTKAKSFRKWVTSEVIPSIRKNGMYATPEFLQKTISDPQWAIGVLQSLAEAQDKIAEQEETIAFAQESIEHKDDVIEGLTKNVPVAELRQRINQIIRQPGTNYKERWILLYSEFSLLYHINLDLQYNRYGDDYKSKLDFVDGYLHMIPELFKVACNVFETDARVYLTKIRDAVTASSEAVERKKKALKEAKKQQSNVIEFAKAVEG